MSRANTFSFLLSLISTSRISLSIRCVPLSPHQVFLIATYRTDSTQSTDSLDRTLSLYMVPPKLLSVWTAVVLIVAYLLGFLLRSVGTGAIRRESTRRGERRLKFSRDKDARHGP